MASNQSDNSIDFKFYISLFTFYSLYTHTYFWQPYSDFIWSTLESGTNKYTNVKGVWRQRFVSIELSCSVGTISTLIHHKMWTVIGSCYVIYLTFLYSIRPFHRSFSNHLFTKYVKTIGSVCECSAHKLAKFWSIGKQYPKNSYLHCILCR